tara:strand:- start:1275 stop:2390 length:1116 start_codon:yes stop_codon:yes gene_type:complete
MEFNKIDIAKETDLELDCGEKLSKCDVAYNTYGVLNKKKSNAILICHALTGDQYCSDLNPISKKPGWWSNLVGPGKSIDTKKYFVICSNVIGGCNGSTGPSSINPKTKKPFNLDFPVITIFDMVRAQVRLVNFLGIEKLFAVVGGSMGGMQALVWGALYENKVRSIIPIATSYRHSAQNIAFHEIGRQAIMTDPNWNMGEYHEKKDKPDRGLSVARMVAHITYLSEYGLQKKFGRNLQFSKSFSYDFNIDFQIESYLKHQGTSFVNRFDANSYLYITKAMDYFDLSTKKGGLSNIFKDNRSKFCFFTFTSDWLFPTSETKRIIKSLNSSNANVSFVEIETDKGHDAFLLNEPEFHKILRGFLGGLEKNGLT